MVAAVGKLKTNRFTRVPKLRHYSLKLRLDQELLNDIFKLKGKIVAR